MSERTAIIIGAGIGGLTAAVALDQAGFRVRVFERARELREAGAGLGIMTNAVSALRALGLERALLRAGRIIEQFQIRDRRGRLIASMPVKELADELGAPSVSISRAALQRLLLEAAGRCELQLATECVHVTSDAHAARAHFADGRSAEADVVIGADGMRSRVRYALAGPEPEPYAGYVCWLATPQFCHPRLTRGHVGHYWGRGKRFGLVDLGGGEVYWWATQNLPESSLGGTPSLRARVEACVRGWPGEVVQAVAATPDAALLEIPARDRPFLKRWGGGRVTLLGDAAHPMLTSLGQGACMAIEDAVVLGRCLSDANAVAGLRRYEALRRARTRRMVVGSRTLSAIEQAEHPWLAGLRDLYFSALPRRVARDQTRAIFDFNSTLVS
jgi:2-polyprenyl-6-methoxyphenol hydroxylase-like FAD-dependent oxidoreductase